MVMIIEPIIQEQWVVDGHVSLARPEVDDALYIKPLLESKGLLRPGAQVLHSLVLDNNVLTDLLEDRRPANNRFLENLLRTSPIELNPVFAMIEQRQKFAKATDALQAYANYLENTFGHSAAKLGTNDFDAALTATKASIIANVDLLSGYLSVTMYLYHQTATAKEKLEWLSGLVRYADLPFFQLHFYFAALVFLAKELPDLFNSKDVVKIARDMEIESTIEKQKKKVLNLSNDLALPTIALFRAGLPTDALVFPYIATRDRLVQLFLSQVICQMVVDAGGGRSNGSWALKEGSLLVAHLGHVISEHLPRRKHSPSKDDISVRKIRLQSFSDLYTSKSVELRAGGPSA